MNYYNEFDPKAAQWLRELIKGGVIPDGDVDERSIQEVRADDLVGYTQCHFFAGIGGWSRALEIARWPRDREIWTASCPCQPFSVAGKGKGAEDERHLWPVFSELVRQRKPSVAVGEQVASKAGRAWFAGVRSDLEALGYSVGGADLCAASVNAPHMRQRLYWIAGLARVAYAESSGARIDIGRIWKGSASSGSNGGLGDAFQSRLEGQSRDGSDGRESGREPEGEGGPAAEAGDASRRLENAHEPVIGEQQHSSEQLLHELGEGAGSWSAFDLIPCTDGKYRRVEPESFPLAYGLPRSLGKASAELRRLAEVAGLDGKSLARAKNHRVVQLKGYGNAIVPELAAEFLAAFMEVEQ